MQSYLDMLEYVKENGKWENNRTGIRRLSIHGYMFTHYMKNGFPLLTTKKMSLKNIAVELEFFIKGLSDKRWLQERGCHIWDSWGNPQNVNKKYNNFININGFKKYTDEILKNVKKDIQREETDLGSIYGVQWRYWKDYYFNNTSYEIDVDIIDQLKNAIEIIKKDPTNTQQVISAWNPSDIPNMALAPCHFAFQLLSDGENLDLIWFQRSCDLFLGIPYNIASYALLLMLIAKEVNLKPNKLIGSFSDLHLYENQLNQTNEQLYRIPYDLPNVNVLNFKSIYDWEYKDLELTNYKYYLSIKADVAV